MRALQEAGIDPFPAQALQSHKLGFVREQFDKLSVQGPQVVVAGRIGSYRGHGGISFFDLQDFSGKMQVVLNKQELGEKVYLVLTENLDVGDFLQVKGGLFKTKAGEPSIKAREVKVLSKALRPLPDSWYGLQDKEVRFRRRYLDLLMNKQVREIFLKRAQLIKEIRQFLEKNGFIEVETPILQPLFGGASARPFKTHMNALDIDLYLRIAPELYLKRLLVGGFERIYELGRNFRNEGLDREHNPEFTMLEFYVAYWDWEDMMEFTEKLLARFGIPAGWQRVDYQELVGEGSEKEVYSKIKKPTFVLNLPDIPLAKAGQAVQGVVGGIELLKIFTEQNNPLQQRQAFKKSKQQLMDEDFLEALEYGMPPAAGFGMGVDRLTMLLTDAKSLRDTILFPTMKPTAAKRRKS